MSFPYDGGNDDEKLETANLPECSRAGLREPSEIDGVVFKIAGCQEEREAAFRLIHQAYTRRGLMAANRAGMRITPYHLLPTTDVLVACHRGNVIYTMTLISDDAMGIPLESVFPDEVMQRRHHANQYLAEVSCLASHEGQLDRGKMYHVFVRLASLMVQSARENGVERLLIACDPRHARFYQSWLGFESISSTRDYAAVQYRPAIALEHDFALQDARKYRLYDRIYQHSFRHWELYHQPMLKEEREHFSRLTELYEAHFPLESIV